MVKVPLTSSAPLPLVVGPLTVMVPPVMVAAPLESNPSPSALTTRVPPLMVSWFAAFAAISPPIPPS